MNEALSAIGSDLHHVRFHAAMRIADVERALIKLAGS
jgi:hypothetical protein